jgi:hypothetical protein
VAALVHGGLGHGQPKGLIGARPTGRSGARWLTGDGAMGREEHWESISGLTRAWAVAWRPGNGSEETVEEVVGVGGAWARREEKEDGETCDGEQRSR